MNTDPDGHICFLGIGDCQKKSDPAGDCGNPCNVNAPDPDLAFALPLSLVLFVQSALRPAPAPRLTQTQMQQILQQPVLGASPFMPPEGELADAAAAGLERAEQVLAEAKESGVAPGIAKQLELHIEKLKAYMADKQGEHIR